MSITVRFACRHSTRISSSAAIDRHPVCPECGDERVVSTDAPVPTFRGAGRGPLLVPDQKVEPLITENT